MGSKDQLSEAFNSSHGPSFVDGGGSSFFITFFINSTLSSLPSRNSLTLFILKKKKNLFVGCMCSLEIALGIELNPGQVIRVDVHGAWVQALLEEGRDR